ncbi:MAG: T9SS type A sorting domain-containing protein [Bacteroidaceae bacterium]|nr:T9SS type A sorting domain-containing protein [Bacteroidaceae bacterium]
MKKVFLLICLLFAQTGLWAQAESLVVVLKSGTSITLNLEDTPQVTFEGDNMKAEAGAVSYTYAFSEIAEMYYVVKELDLTDVRSVRMPASNLELRQVGNDGFSLNGLKASGKVQVCSLDGRVVLTVEATQDGQAEVSLSHLPKGVYLLRTDGQAFKVMKK